MLWLTYTPVTTDAAHHYGVSSGAVGWLAEIFPLLYVVLALPAGRLLDRDLPRWLALGAVLTALGALVRLQDGYAAVLAGQVLVAVAQPLVLNAVTAVSSRYLAADDRATGIAVSSASIFAGMLVALVLGAALGGARIPLLVTVQAVLAVVAALALCVALRRPGEHPAPAGTVGDADVSGLRAVWADPGMRRLTGLVCAGFGVFIALTTWLQALLKPAGVSDTAAGYLLLAMVVAGVAASAALPPSIERRGGQARFVAASVVVGVLGLVALAWVPGIWTGLVALVLVGAFLLADLPVILGLAERRSGRAAATATALIWLAGNAAGLVAALVVQTLLHHPAIAFVVLAVLLAVATPLVRGITDDARRPAPVPLAEAAG
ncbi:MAG: MFS transporter [Jatrophihabitans endophyticus]|nr:MFS transporter [Jatrophihabitans endophyticus]